ncbi:F-box only protein 22-like [Tropilaelaps mercedesae]|uniref:F-box only protein 22-like n=1 Tax=Tropilaelaps mercedesae TaxID=418985 RepID=A0A1V9XKX7_9ACAR|nr:F-box only protein 22-like [Tropilaelaps mercedesae]
MELRHGKRPRLHSDIKKTEDENWIGSILTSNPVIVEHLMRFLTAKQLYRALAVCTLWRDYARKEKQKRFEIQQFGFSVARETNGREELPPFHTTIPENVGKHFYQVIDKLRADPRIVFVFTTQRVVCKAVKYFEDFSPSPANFRSTWDCLKRTKRHIYNLGLCNHLSAQLPQSAEIFLCTSWGMICYNFGVGPLEIEDSDGFSALILPKMAGVEFTSFRLLQEDCVYPYRNAEMLAEVSGLSRVQDVKALLLFASERLDAGTAPTKLIDYMIRQNPDMAFGGALVCDFAVPVDGISRKVISMAGLAVHGPGVRAVSVMLDPDCRGRDKVRARLRPIGKSFGLVPGRSIALLFACSGRGVYFHQEQNVETEAFCELFPDVPVVGLFGNGEFGYNSLPENGSRVWQHSYSSIFVLLDFDPTIGRASSEGGPSEGRL